MKWFIILGAFMVCALLAAGCAETAPTETTPTPTPAATETPAPANIIDTASAAGSFTTLLAAVDAAGLTDTLSGEGPFTVFAPTDDAFAALPEGTVETLLADPEGDLRDILLYHVVAGKVMAEDVVALDSVTSLEGSTISIETNGEVTVDGATVITTDIECSNGVIHVIDAVMLPP